jgi:hypothetical protein
VTSIDFNALTRMAEDAGYSTKELEPGTYTAEVKSANYTTKSNGKSQFGFRFVVEGGPFNGQSEWKNINVPDPRTSTDPQKLAQAAGFFIRDLNSLGVDQAVAAQNPEAAAKAIIGRKFQIEVKRSRPKGDGTFWTDVNVKKALDAAPPAPVQQQIPVEPPHATPAWQASSRPI